MYNLPSTQAARDSLSSSSELLWLLVQLSYKRLYIPSQQGYIFRPSVIIIYWVWKTTDDQIDGRRHGGGIICLVEINCPLFASANPRKKIYTHMVFDPHQKPTLVTSGGCAQRLHSTQNQLERKRSLLQLVYLTFSGKNYHVESPPTTAEAQYLSADALAWQDSGSSNF